MLQESHEILPTATHDEFAREEFCASLRKFFTTELWPGNVDIYKGKQLPAFRRRERRDPATHKEVEALMEETYYYRASNLVGRVAQEMLWDTVGESIERQMDDLNAKAVPREGDIGTLRLNPDLPMPRYIEAVDIHVMPGNFQTQRCEGDVTQGALYDRGVYVFSFGGLGPKNEGLGEAVAAMVKSRFPDLKPRRILDIGCGPGFSEIPLVDAFPDAEVHAIDVGAPMVTYGHRRAESLGRKVHFSQQDMTHTDFPDGYFDLVVSMLVTHECPTPVNRAMFKECYRLLAPGGVMMHDGSTNRAADPVGQVMMSWFSHNANEPFSYQMKQLDYRRDFEAAGFPADGFFEGTRPPVYLKGHLPGPSFVGSRKAL
jgi:ubiquinone/menaquinone biosynthesis C-methylase UbiE